MQKKINEELDRMLELGVIEHSKSEWCSSIVMVKKKDHTFRFVTDFRQFNKIFINPTYPLPFVHEILDS